MGIYEFNPRPPKAPAVRFSGKNCEKFKGESEIFAVRKGTCFAWGGGLLKVRNLTKIVEISDLRYYQKHNYHNSWLVDT